MRLWQFVFCSAEAPVSSMRIAAPNRAIAVAIAEAHLGPHPMETGHDVPGNRRTVISPLGKADVDAPQVISYVDRKGHAFEQAGQP